MIEVDEAPLVISAVAVAGIMTKQLWPYAVQLLSIRGKVTIDDRRRIEDRKESAPTPPVYTKEEHDKWCALRLETISTRLTGIEGNVADVKEHENEAKQAVREIWARLDTVVDKMHNYHADTLKAINAIGK
jgi:hypothetical protein